MVFPVVRSSLALPWLKVALLGDAQVGKTMWIARFTAALDPRHLAFAAKLDELNRGRWRVEGDRPLRHAPSATIQPALVPVSTQSRAVLLVDTPSGPAATHNVLYGLGIADAVIAVVPTWIGVGPVLRGQLRAAFLLGKTCAGILLLDWGEPGTPDPVLRDAAESEARTALTTAGFAGDDVPVIASFDEALDAFGAHPLPARDFEGLLCVDILRMFSITGRGTVVVGPVCSGTVRKGQRLAIIGPLRWTPQTQMDTVAQNVRQFDVDVAEVGAGAPVSILVRGLMRYTATRATTLTVFEIENTANSAVLAAHPTFDVEVHDEPDAVEALRRPLRSGERVQLYARTFDVTVIVAERRDDRAVLVADRNVAFERGDRFVLRHSHRLVASGAIIGAIV